MLALAVLGCACHTDTTTAPTPPAAAPTTTETFSGTLAVGTSRFYSFSVTMNGEVDITLASVTGTNVPPTVTLTLGFGVPAGTSCTLATTTSAQAGSTAQITGTYPAGVYCVLLADAGNLIAPATFAVTIAHP